VVDAHGVAAGRRAAREQGVQEDLHAARLRPDPAELLAVDEHVEREARVHLAVDPARLSRGGRRPGREHKRRGRDGSPDAGVPGRRDGHADRMTRP